mgnify:CR=1 FL=1
MLRVMKARDGYTFANKDKTQVVGALLYLGIYDTPENYVEITLDEAGEIMKQNEEIKVEE